VQLDIRTLLFVIAIVSSIASLVIFLVHKFRYSVEGTSSWALGYVIMTVSFILLSFREIAPVFISITLANTCVILSLGLLYSGIRQFVGRTSLFKYTLFAPLLFLPLFYWYSEIDESLLARIIIVSSAMAFYSLLISLELLRHKGKQNLPAIFFTAFVYLLNAIVFSVRIIASWMQGLEGPFLQTGLQTVLLFLYYIFLVLFSTFGKIMMISEKLEKTVEKQTRDLKASNARLESFNYTLSHDLKSPLHLVQEYSEMMGEALKDRLNEKEKKICQKISSYSNRAASIVRDILRFSSITPASLYKRQFDLVPIFDATVEIYRETYPDREIEIKRDARVEVYGDRELLKLVIENLLQNAIKFSSSKLKIFIKFGSIRKGGKTVVYLKDKGIGFKPEDTERMFLPFTRIHQEHEKSGTGIGLATVSRIIDLHGGKIWAEGEPGDGAVFYFSTEPLE
jgi:signal transduction histidine kinase